LEGEEDEDDEEEEAEEEFACGRAGGGWEGDGLSAGFWISPVAASREELKDEDAEDAVFSSCFNLFCCVNGLLSLCVVNTRFLIVCRVSMPVVC
jgi:hypothetical protein